jgi:hypothetical protein
MPFTVVWSACAENLQLVVVIPRHLLAIPKQMGEQSHMCKAVPYRAATLI